MSAPTGPMTWQQLLSARRPSGLRAGAVGMSGDAAPDPARARSPFQIDVDRIIFSSAFRRLQNKTQVHPLSDNDHVHTRLTHTIEVASVGQSLGLMAGKWIVQRLGANTPFSAADIGYIVQAACLAHDIGNPPFGHSGEDAIKDWFENSAFANRTLRALTPREIGGDEFADLCHFEGNAQGFRIISALEMYRYEGGLRLTAATLGAFTKYPRSTGFKPGIPKQAAEKKPGFYQAEQAVFKAMAEECGLPLRSAKGDAYARHPLVYLVEAADDICYSVVDLEDGWELGCVTFEEVETALAPIARHPDKYGADPAHRIADLQTQNWYAHKTPREKLGFLRGKAIGNLVQACANAFEANEAGLLAGTLDKDLMSYTAFGAACRACKALAVARIYHAEHVLPTEIAGFKVIHGLLDHFIAAAVDLHENGPEAAKPQTRRILKLLGHKLDGAESLYDKILRVLDYIGGMTDRYAVSLYRKLQGIAV